MQFTLRQEFLAELFGTMVLLMFGTGVVAMVVLFGSPQMASGGVVNGGFTNITLGWGFAVTMGIYIAGTVSGAHLNPAVTIALAVSKRFAWPKVVPYISAQMIGAFLGAAITFGVYQAKWFSFDPGLTHSAGILATFPAVPGFWPGFLDQVAGTALLMAMILAVSDKTNNRKGQGFTPLAVGFIVMAIGMSFGGMHGYAINPARDFGPRLFALLAGFQNVGFDNGVWIVPVIGPIVGGVLGTFLYDMLIGQSLSNADAKHRETSGPGPAHSHASS